jgi:cytochrome c biogenesis protein CcmG, thiol:disulfide interchange protein DsbE
MTTLNIRTVFTFAALLALVAVGTAAIMARRDHAVAVAATASPPLTGKTLQHKTFALSQTLGRPTVVNFFASWCPSCAAEAADIAAFAAAHPEIRVVGVAIRDKRADVQAFVRKYELPYTVVLDPMSIDANGWNVVGIPATFFLDAQGRTVSSMVGAATRARFEDGLDAVR